MRKLAVAVRRHGGQLLVVGDRKGPAAYALPNAELVTLSSNCGCP